LCSDLRIFATAAERCVRFGESNKAPRGTILSEPETTIQQQRKPASGLVFAVVNQKGGVGKTTTAVNLAASFAASERSTLLLDLDPQANATSAFGVAATRHVYDAISGHCVMKDVVQSTELDFLDLIPSGRDLYGAEIELASMLNRERQLERSLSDLRQAYEFVFIDCPPSLGLLTLNALCAASRVIIPLQCEYYALEGLAGLLETVKLVREQLNPELGLEGILLTMVDQRNNLSRQVGKEVRDHFGVEAYETEIPRNVRLSEAPSHGKPALLYDIHSKGAISYLRLADEILRRYPRPSHSIAPTVLSDGSAPEGNIDE
jgi:chromosome partitioning protein